MKLLILLLTGALLSISTAYSQDWKKVQGVENGYLHYTFTDESDNIEYDRYIALSHIRKIHTDRRYNPANGSKSDNEKDNTLYFTVIVSFGHDARELFFFKTHEEAKALTQKMVTSKK